MTQAASPAIDSGPRGAKRARLLRLAWIELFLVLGAATVVVMFVESVRSDVVGLDLWQFYVAAEAILRGESPYVATPDSTALWGGPYPYPPLPAILATPLTVLPFQAAGLVVMGVLVVVALSVPYVLGVRDWRCYGIMLVWPSTIAAIQTGNVTLWFALASAIAWRYRDRRLPSGVSVGVTLATKFFLWPLLVWFAATRRLASAAVAVAVGTTLLLVSWAAIGFAGFSGYPALVRRLEDAVGEDSYTLYIVGLDLGLPSAAARALWLAAGIALLALLVVFARRGDEQSAFILAIAASLALTPIVWLHYFALLLVVIALAQPRLGVLWFVPLGMILTPGSGHPSPLQTAWTLFVAGLIVALAIRETRALTRAAGRVAPGARAIPRET